MSLLFGIVARGQHQVRDEWLLQAGEAAQWPADAVDQAYEPRRAFLLRQRRTMARMALSPPIARAGDSWLMVDGRIDNRAEMASAIGLSAVEELSDAELLLAGWRALGEDLLPQLRGDFALAIHDGGDAPLVLARDHIGVRPLYLVETAEFTAFASAMPPLLALPFTDRRWNPHWVVDYLEQVKPDYQYTPFAGIRALPPAHVLRVHAGHREAREYWSLPLGQRPLKIDPQEAVRETRRLLDQAVACRLAETGRTACELSGGLDSSSLALIASDKVSARGERLLGVTQAMPPDFAERYADIAEGHFADTVYAHDPRIERLDVLSQTDSLLAMLSGSLERHGAPPRNDFNAVASDAPRLLAERGVGVLLSGYGGDQLVTVGMGGYEEGLVHDGNWTALASRFLRHGGRVPALQRLVRDMPLLGRLVPPAARLRHSPPPLASEAALQATGYPERAELHLFPPGTGSLQQRDAANFRRPVLAYRLQDSQVGAGALGIEYRYPMLDVRLMEFVHQLPTTMRLAPGEPRKLIRAVMQDRLPEKVRLRMDKHGLTVPAVFANVVTHAAELRSFFEGLQESSTLSEYARFDDVLAILDYAVREGETPKETSVKAGVRDYRGANQGQAMRLALLGLWERSGKGEPVPLAAVQPNQTV